MYEILKGGGHSMVKPIETIPEGVKHIHCIGIGGSGMFPLVQILHGRGYTITGSDNNESDIVNLERQMGIEVMMGQRAEISGAPISSSIPPPLWKPTPN